MGHTKEGRYKKCSERVDKDKCGVHKGGQTRMDKTVIRQPTLTEK
jgi:hypothetical protein